MVDTKQRELKRAWEQLPNPVPQTLWQVQGESPTDPTPPTLALERMKCTPSLGEWGLLMTTCPHSSPWLWTWGPRRDGLQSLEFLWSTSARSGSLCSLELAQSGTVSTRSLARAD